MFWHHFAFLGLLGIALNSCQGQMTAEPCEDHVGNGLSCADLPSICTDQYASRLCRKFCNNCDGNSVVGTTEAPLLRKCVDDIGHGMTCDQVPGICNDVYGQLLCRRHCRLCTDEGGHVTPTPAPTHTPGECVDHVIGDLTCSQLPNICLGSLASRFCPHFCGYCNGQLTQNSCVDHVINGLHCSQIPNICSTVYGHIVCKDFCETCEKPSEAGCYDSVGLGLSCDQLPEVCIDPTMVGPQLLCRQYCGTCSSKPCINHVIHDVKCNALPNVCSTAARHACPEQCGACTNTTYVPPPLQPSPSDPCYDRVGDGMTCADLPGVCEDPVGRYLCRRFCGDCTTIATTPPPTTRTPTTTATTTTTTTTTTQPTPTTTSGPPCIDHVAFDFECLTIPNVCQGPGAAACAKTCGQCVDNGDVQPPLHSSSSASCVDRVGYGLSCAHLPGVCDDTAGRLFLCQHYCGTCNKTLHGPPTTAFCFDVVGQGLHCDDLKTDGFCQDPWSHMVCNFTCGHCTPMATTTVATLPPTTIPPTTIPPTTPVPTTTAPPTTPTTQAPTTTTPAPTTPTTTTTTTTLPPTTTQRPTYAVITTTPGPCIDKLPGNGCASFNSTIDVCASSTARRGCPRFCGDCCVRNPNPECMDIAEPQVCKIQGFCQDPYAKVVCQRSCGICKYACQNELERTSSMKCADLYGAGRTFSTKELLCADSLASKVCEATCGCPGYCTDTTVSPLL